MKRLLLLLLLAMGMAPVRGALMPTYAIVIRTNAVDAPWGPISISSSKTSGIQEAVDAMLKASSLSGVTPAQGGGKIIFTKGIYTLTTNVVFPNQFQFSLEMEGTGARAGTILVLKNTNQDKTRGYFRAYTNWYLGLPLTNTLQLDVHGIMFAQEDMLSTNCIFEAFGRSRFHDNTFTTCYGWTNGQGLATMNWEANVPNQPIGACGIFAGTGNPETGSNGDSANSHFYCDNNTFYCLANAIWVGTVESHIEHNYFSCIGVYNPTTPPTVANSNLHVATNLWRQDIGGAAHPLSSGAAIWATQVSGLSVVAFNEFFGCGICGVPGLECQWLYNRYSLCGYRFGQSDDWGSLNCKVIECHPSSGEGTSVGSTLDVALTNSVDTTWMQPDGPHVGLSAVPRTIASGNPMVFNGFNDGSGSAGTHYWGFSGGPVIATNGFIGGWQWPILTKTANYSVLAGDTGTTFNNSGAGGTMTNTLPASAVGLQYSFDILTAQNVTIKAVGSDTIRSGATATAAAGFVNAATVGSTLSLHCPVAGQWIITSTNGPVWGFH